MTQRRPHTIPLRLSDAALSWIDKVAKEHSLPRSVVMREAMTIGTKHEDELRKRLAQVGADF